VNKPLENLLKSIDPAKAKAELSRRFFKDFIEQTKPEYEFNWHHLYIANKLQDFFLNSTKNRLMIFCPPQHGKELSHDTPMLTTEGWKTHGDLKVGDYVFNRNGKPTKVIALSEETYSEFDITFSDGTIIQCHGNHEWVVYDRKSKKEIKIDTYSLFKRKLNTGEKKRGNRNIIQLDKNVLIDFEAKKLLLHPYVLGCWLGDGSKTTNVITHHENDIEHIDKIISLGYNVRSLSKDKNNVCVSRFDKIYKELKEIGVLFKKHIPEIYLLGSVEQRLELLAGLIDTDGYVYHKNGRVTFTNIDYGLIKDIKKLVNSLGWRVSITAFDPIISTSGIEGKSIVYQLCFNPDMFIPCALDRKKPINITPAIRKRGIVKIEIANNPKKGRCIQVDGGIYLAGETLIPTHNSELVSRRLPAWLFGKNPDLKIIGCSYSSDLATSFNR
jgi:hypothetical protein